MERRSKSRFVNFTVNQTLLKMEAVALKLPITFAEREDAPEILRVEATWEEYLELAEILPYHIDYLNGEIISMSQATDIHEQLVIQLGALLVQLYDDLPDYQTHRVLGSSVKICVKEAEAEFNADLSVVKGPSDYVTLPSGRVSKVQITNPVIIVEVLSKSTKAYDQSDKLDQYRLLPSLQHILFVSQEDVFARVYSRTTQPNQWVDVDYRSIDDSIVLNGLELPLRTIYRRTPLTT